MSSAGVVTAHIRTADNQTFVLDKPEQTVGREPGVDHIIPDKSVSRVHAVLRCKGSQWTIEDLESRNKTFVNEKAIAPKTQVPIADGAVIHFGFVKVEFRFGLPAERAAGALPDATIAFDPSKVDASKAFADLKAPKSTPRAAEGAHHVESVASADEGAYAYLELCSVDSPMKHYIRKDHVKVGTDPRECEIVLTEREAEIEQCEIRFEKTGKVSIKNLAQTTKTFVNGRVVAKATLDNNAQIKIGDSVYNFVILKYPALDDQGGSVAKSAIKFVAFIFAVSVIAGGGYFWYIRDQEQKRAANKTEIISSVADPKAEVMDLISTRKYQDAAQKINALRSAPDTPEDIKGAVEAWDADLKILMSSLIFSRNRDHANAYVAASKINESGDVYAAALNDISTIKENFQNFIKERRDKLTTTERAEDWQGVLTSIIPDLLNFDAQNKAQWETAKRRVELKQNLDGIYKQGLVDLDRSFELVIERAEKAIQEAEAILSADAGMRQEVDRYLQRVADLKTHAELLRGYFAYEGQQDDTLDKLRALSARISTNYDKEKLADVAQRLQRLETAFRLQGEFLKIQEEIASTNPKGLPLVEKLDAMDRNREALALVDLDKRFKVNSTVSQDRQDIATLKKNTILEVWRRTAKPITATGSAGRIEAQLEIRERTFEVLAMFPPQVRKDRDDPAALRQLVPDAEVLEVFRQAVKRHTESREIILQIIFEEHRTSKDPTVLSNTEKYLERLKTASLNEDAETESKIMNIRQRISGSN